MSLPSHSFRMASEFMDDDFWRRNHRRTPRRAHPFPATPLPQYAAWLLEVVQNEAKSQKVSMDLGQLIKPGSNVVTIQAVGKNDTENGPCIITNATFT